jgi:hypothetical protein
MNKFLIFFTIGALGCAPALLTSCQMNRGREQSNSECRQSSEQVEGIPAKAITECLRIFTEKRRNPNVRELILALCGSLGVGEEDFVHFCGEGGAGWEWSRYRFQLPEGDFDLYVEGANNQSDLKPITLGEFSGFISEPMVVNYMAIHRADGDRRPSIYEYDFSAK